MPRLSSLLADARITPLRLVGGADCEITAITADSRQVKNGALFVAIPGVKNDGAVYINDALTRGAAAIVKQSADACSVVPSPLRGGLGRGASGSPQKISSPPPRPSPQGGGSTEQAARIEVPDARTAIALLAAAFYPKQPKHLFAITGTDGKTSTADFVRQLAVLLGEKAASIGTLGLRSGDAARDAAFPANHTSPEPVLLHRTLQSLAQAGVEMVAIEASSHGLDQKRLDGVKFSAAAFTNLTRDHLDYHGTLESYAAAKARLFAELLPPGATAILNRDDAQFKALRAVCKTRQIIVKSFGYHADADYRIVAVTPHAQGLDAKIALKFGTAVPPQSPLPHGGRGLGEGASTQGTASPTAPSPNLSPFGGEGYGGARSPELHNSVVFSISLPLYGAFQLSNILAAIGLLHSTGIALDDLVAFLPKLQGVPGRLEKVATHPCDAPIFIDYAHTPAALENILKTLRAHTKNQLHVVFGCGGDRDAGKRPEMGRAAVQFADHVIVTDDNPRSENPAAIRAAIMAVAPSAQEIPGRDAAIAEAVKQLRAGDVLVVAGKGHEQTQIIGEQTIHFSDAEHVQQSVRNL